MTRLLTDLPVPVPGGIMDKARVLDAHYIPARYPDGSPFEQYTILQSMEAIHHAEEIVEYADDERVVR